MLVFYFKKAHFLKAKRLSITVEKQGKRELVFLFSEMRLCIATAVKSI